MYMDLDLDWKCGAFFVYLLKKGPTQFQIEKKSLEESNGSFRNKLRVDCVLRRPG